MVPTASIKKSLRQVQGVASLLMSDSEDGDSDYHHHKNFAAAAAQPNELESEKSLIIGSLNNNENHLSNKAQYPFEISDIKPERFHFNPDSSLAYDKAFEKKQKQKLHYYDRGERIPLTDKLRNKKRARKQQGHQLDEILSLNQQDSTSFTDVGNSSDKSLAEITRDSAVSTNVELENNTASINVDSEKNSLERFWPRLFWLIGLFVVQSMSSVILQGFEGLVVHHPVVMYFLTTLVGSGGNAGSQSTVLVIRNIAVGKLTRAVYLRVVLDQLKLGLAIATVLSITCFIRTYFVEPDAFEVFAVCTSMFLIVITSVFIGTGIPILFKMIDIDPAHAGAAIQVITDIVGVLLVCISSHLILDKFAPWIKPSYLPPLKIIQK